MVPVELHLKNFLSYGTEAPPLRFEEFHVACLSGRNGQGKSALLDAVTWALWGEARKSSGNRKPDDDLLRIGTRHMQVELVFDVEGTRYRVTRSYQRSATGKTTKSGLEFHFLEPGAGDYRPLTGASQRETQAQIERTLGLGYDTFINSAFLLQGRSDEFTKKRPSERKEILARILDLNRYKKLARRARDRWREAKEAQQLAANEVGRLENALDDVPAHRRARKEVRKEIKIQQERLGVLRAEEKALAGRLTELEAKAREARSLEQVLEAAGRRLVEHREEAQALCERIAKADALIENADAIERDYDRFERFRRERNDLDRKRDLYRGTEKQIERRTSDLKDRKNELEKRLHRLEVEQKSDRDARKQCEAQLSKAPALRKALEAARAARERRDALVEVRERRRALERETNDLRQTLDKRHEALKSEHRALERQIQEAERALTAEDDLQAREEALLRQKKELEALRDRREEVREDGQALAGAIRTLEGTIEARRDERVEREQQLAHLRATHDGRCPTCGSELTEAHRQTAIRRYEKTVAALTEAMEEGARAKQAKETRRAELRASYTALGEKIDALASVPEVLATIRQQRQEEEKRRAALAEKHEEAVRLGRKIEQNAFGREARTRWKACREALAGLSFDEEAFERVNGEALRVKDHEERLRELEEQAGRKEQLEKRRAARARELETLRETMDDGSAFGAVQEQIRSLRGQLAGVGFDAGRFQEVRARLDALSEAGPRLKDLLNARQNRADWQAQLERTEARIGSNENERAAAASRLQALREALKGREERKAEQEAKAAACRVAEAQLNDRQQRLGELNRRLEEAERDRAALDERRQELKGAKARRHLYRQLQKAFGKHGIPSLIIEQTLPEIEERANELLERLTDGRMHVRLETLRDKKTGGTKETLEIIITDEQGVPRAYETFSGGEAFRVNFALRIALAQLLAERSGVRVRTLVVDEGFGTQDAEGLQNLIDAIRVIRADFDKILVITHLEELKAQFPVRIEVEKDPLTGSSFELIGA